MRGSAVFRTGIAPGGALAGPWVRDPLWTRARAVPSLDLRFADNKSLVDAITGAQLVTFTRASTGTFVGSDGVLRSAVTNLSLRSQELGDAAWTKALSSITADAAIAPNGTTTADKLVEDSSTGTHNIIEAATITYTSGLAYTFSFFVKKAERQTVQIVMNANPFPGGLGTRTGAAGRSSRHSEICGGHGRLSWWHAGAGVEHALPDPYCTQSGDRFHAQAIRTKYRFQ